METFIPLAKPDLSGNEKLYVSEALENGELSHRGPFVRRLEDDFSRYVGKTSLAVSSGTAAIHLALLSLNIGSGDEVIIPVLCFGTLASVVLAVGAKPVILDIDPDTWGLDRGLVRKYVNERTKAIVPVNLYGIDAGGFRGFGVPVVEDACESLGMVSPRGDIVCYSLYANKVVTTGEGGMISTNIPTTKAYRDGGFDENYLHTIPGLNYRMTNIQAAIGVAQMERLGGLVSQRIVNAELYSSILYGKGRWLFVADVENPVAVAGKLPGIETRPVFTPLHRCPAFKPYASGEYSNADRVWKNGLCLPTGPHVTQEQVKMICNMIEAANGD